METGFIRQNCSVCLPRYQVQSVPIIDYMLYCLLLYEFYFILYTLYFRSPAEYAVLETILNEIKRKDPEFSPSTLFDFGSGVGTGYWATKKVFGKLGEVIETAMSCLRRGIPFSDPCYLDCVCCLTTFLPDFSV